MFTLLGALVVFASAGLLAPQGVIASSQQPAYASNHILVKLKPGKPISDLSGFAGHFNARVRKNTIGKSICIVDLPKGVTPSQIVNNSAALISRYKSVEKFSYDYKCSILAPALPNDTFYSDQWALQPGSHIFAPEGWNYFSQVPTQEVVVAVVDTGIRDRSAVNPDKTTDVVRTPHPDLLRSLLVGQGFDFGEFDFDPSPTEYSLFSQVTGHGTHVAGIIAAQSNNQLGVAGLANNTQSRVKVWILPVKVADYHGDMFVSALLNALINLPSWPLRSPATNAALKVNVVNMSLGFSVDVPEIQQAIRTLTDNGIVVVCASGDDSGPVNFPAAYPESIAVGASDDNDTVADFSSFGPELDLVAPGVDVPSTIWTPDIATFKFKDVTDSGSGGGNTGGGITPPAPGPSNLIPDQFYAGDIYGNAIVGWDGTSMASPHVAAAAAMLISTGVPPAEVAQYLKENATDIGYGVPSAKAGYGLLNLSNSLSNSTVNMWIVSPSNGGVSPSLKTKFRIDFRNADIDTIRVFIDGVLVAGPANENPAIPNWKNFYSVFNTDNKSRLQFDYVVNGDIKDHELVAQAYSATIPPAGYARAVRNGRIKFTVNRTTLTQGWNLFSIPFWYESPRTPEAVLNSNSATLFRWTYASSEFGQYAKYVCGPSGTPKDAEATFAPPSLLENGSILSPLGSSIITAPAGLGYWLKVADADGQPVPDTFGTSVESGPYQIGLNNGWNLVGNPFIFPVSWDNIMIEYNGIRVTAAEAASNGWIVDAIFRWDKTLNGGQGDYVRKSISKAIMVPWEAQWLRARVKGAQTWPSPDMKLIVPPNPYTGLIP